MNTSTQRVRPRHDDRARVGREPAAGPRTVRVDVEQAHLVAAAFVEAPRSTADPILRAAYTALAGQADRLFDRVAGRSARRPIRVVYTSCPKPYASGAELAHRVRSERILELCPAKYDRDRSHPLLDAAVGGPLDRFRAVHDIVSHAGCGYGFDRDGEFAAWLTEDRLYSGLARWALATELHAEHSVLWTTGSRAEHKATLLPLDLLAASSGRR